jgi:hypothetical protein
MKTKTNKGNCLILDGPINSFLLPAIAAGSASIIGPICDILNIPTHYTLFIAVFGFIIALLVGFYQTEFIIYPQGSIFHKKFVFWKKYIGHKDDLEAIGIDGDIMNFIFKNKKKLKIAGFSNAFTTAKNIAEYLDLPLESPKINILNQLSF